ncbi:hypothetical protein Rsub_08945 [Raphidocelis subcapitata]|uniref:Uncharacterized protein n=1 Tax=Raphidocelis subcapitata TaxID=307507 RepID=A0A2V0P924_9CHLO|nr:hypothetical protein Rsub_08945 [Raphidocelis subcapitata]|eukprot:GBF96069.1 hypothetical protein Rsub_08945 [Raphidocelis subcapitata]
MARTHIAVLLAALACAALLAAPAAAAGPEGAPGRRLRVASPPTAAPPAPIGGLGFVPLVAPGSRKLAQATETKSSTKKEEGAPKEGKEGGAKEGKEGAAKEGEGEKEEKPEKKKPVWVTIGAYGSVKEWDEMPALKAEEPKKADAGAKKKP